jgi:hypothetical protein
MPPFLVPAHAGDYQIYLLQGTYLHGYNIAFMQIDALEAFIDDGAAYTATDDALLSLVPLSVDTQGYHYLWNDDAEAYEVVIPMDDITYDNPADEPEGWLWARCPHCKRYISTGPG